MRWTLSFSHIHRITQDRNLLTFPLWGPPSGSRIWFHFCWPGWKLKLSSNPTKVSLRPILDQELKLELKLTSTTTTSTFTFGGRSSSGWKHLTMATSRWRVARRSLLWMTDRRTAENKTHKEQLVLIWQNSPPPSMQAKKGQKDLFL